jgi:hypothetical protein
MKPELIEAVKLFVREKFAMTDEEWAQTKISYDPSTETLNVDFGNGLKASPERTTALRRWVMGLPTDEKKPTA